MFFEELFLPKTCLIFSAEHEMGMERKKTAACGRKRGKPPDAGKACPGTGLSQKGRRRRRGLLLSGRRFQDVTKPGGKISAGLFAREEWRLCGCGRHLRLKTLRTVSTACMVYSGLAASWKRSFMKDMGS